MALVRQSLFSVAILAETLVKITSLAKFDGTSDPQEHLDKFYTKIDLYDLSDATSCKIFWTTLMRKAPT